ncbi:MAG: protein translocase subunit SecD [Acidobacteria bacterium]|nr:MAG: protein translocase subunit SecD [Acidobacteriota bacterium]
MRFRWIIILLAILLSLFHLFKTAEGEEGYFSKELNIRYGLDLQGGIFMQLEVDTDDAVRQYIEEQAGSIKVNLETSDFKVGASTPFPAEKKILLKDVQAPKGEESAYEKIKDDYVNWTVNQTDEGITMSPKSGLISNVQEQAISQTVTKIQNRIDELGVTEPIITRALNSNRIILELAGADDVERVHNIVKEPGKLEWRMVHPGSTTALTEAELLAPYNGVAPEGTKIIRNISRPGQTAYSLVESVLLTASNIRDVYHSRDRNGMPAVGITLDRSGSEIFSKTTADNIGNNLAVVLDGKIISAPEIMAHLSDPRFIIQGNFTDREVGDMVVKIKSGSLPAEVRILEERVIGPTLGRDSIEQGAKAAALGIILVVIFMLVWYRRAGFYSVLALVLNLIFILGMLSAIGSVLTLPGIAGFILTIGMAVDANVLVFERIKEELKSGLSVVRAVDAGFKTAYVTIMDANITTFIAAFCLLLMGQGPIKGFAVMLMIGIVSSIFTAVFCSRTFFLAYLGNSKHKKVSIWPVFAKSPVE